MAKRAAVIGATGFVGSHVSKLLLEKGYMVRGACRNPDAATWLKDLPNGKNMELFQIDLLSDKVPQQLDELLNGANVAFFCAGHEKQEPATIDFMVNSAVQLLQAARRQSAECVVLTSSGGSTNPVGHKDQDPKNEIDHWSDPEEQKSRSRWSPAAKTSMEIAAFTEVGRNQRNDVVDEEKAKGAPRLCIMNPNLILGPQLNPGPPGINSLLWVSKILKGEVMTDGIKNDSMSIIDVRDLAALHVACYEKSDASGRYFGVNRSFPWEEILATFETEYPPYKRPPRFEGEAKVPTQFDHTRKESLGVTLRSLEETVKDLIDWFNSKGLLEP
eukprot:Clim_evm3s62 gene=Clim_evmTU3s62